MDTPRPTTAKEMLHQIRIFLGSKNTPQEEKVALWHIMGAVRGPDTNEPGLKFRTTARIRRDAFGQIICKMVGADCAYDKDPAKEYVSTSDHFNQHISLAKDALERK